MARDPYRGRQPARREPGPRRGRSFGGRLLYWTAVLGVWGVVAAVAFIIWLAVDLPNPDTLQESDRQPSITFLDRSGALIGTRGGRYSADVTLAELPEYVPAAFIAVEDRRFYGHPGFDVIGIGRSLVRNARCLCIAGGGSTITQQLARNLFLTPDQNLKRKGQEILLAVWLEQRYSKEEILTQYLNRVDFGAGAIGIEAASLRYFNKPASRLTVGEAALLVGLLKAPTRYSPVSNTARAERRANIVLAEMVENGAITEQQRAQAVRSQVAVFRQGANVRAQYFIDWIMTGLAERIGDVREDVVVETTLDLPIQASAERAVAEGVAAARNQGVRQAALVALDGGGRVRAMVGGADYLDSQFNRAVDARRQAGSAFKPFVYLAAMEAGFTPESQVVDRPITIGRWSPRNYTGRFLGPISVSTALTQSVNTVAAELADQVGRDRVASTARRLGMNATIQLQPSMALGAVEVSPLDMAQSYAPFSNGGRLALAYGVNRVRTRSGRVLFQHQVGDGAGQTVISNPALSYMNAMMRSVVASGTGTGARVAGFDIAGKTGTTSDYRDAWFVGYTGGFVTAVWVGKDDNTAMRRVTGGNAPARIWRTFMTAALPRLDVRAIPDGPAAPAGATYGDPIGDLLAPDYFGEDTPGYRVIGPESPPEDDYAIPPAPEPEEDWSDGPPILRPEDEPPLDDYGYGPEPADWKRDTAPSLRAG